MLIYYRQEKNWKRKYVLIKDVNTLTHDNTSDHGGKYFCWFSLQTFSTRDTLKLHTKDLFKINGK